MTLNFTKMNGAGNDFVVVDNRDNSLDDILTEANIARLCNRQRGIGADGFLAVEPGTDQAPHTMRYHNADGSSAEMCGNGARCFGKYLDQLLNNQGQQALPFQTPAGTITARFLDNGDVEIQMSAPFDRQLNLQLDVQDQSATLHHWNTGVPHVVEIVEDLNQVDIRPRGRALRIHDHFQPAGANANFQQVLQPGSIAIRTYERGVEDETLACGTGVVANALIHSEIEHIQPPIQVRVAGGETLQVTWDKQGDQYHNVRLQGPATTTFTGTITV